MIQMKLFESPGLIKEVEDLVLDILDRYQQPSAREMLLQVEKVLGLEARWDLKSVVLRLSKNSELTVAKRQYFRSMIEDGSLDSALRGEDATDQEVKDVLEERDPAVYRVRDYLDTHPTLKDSILRNIQAFRGYLEYREEKRS